MKEQKRKKMQMPISGKTKGDAIPLYKDKKNEKFDLEVTDAQLENYLCEIYRMFSKIPSSIAIVGDWKQFGKQFVELHVVQFSFINIQYCCILFLIMSSFI